MYMFFTFYSNNEMFTLMSMYVHTINVYIYVYRDTYIILLYRSPFEVMTGSGIDKFISIKMYPYILLQLNIPSYAY
jgi:hypothetical protein